MVVVVVLGLFRVAASFVRLQLHEPSMGVVAVVDHSVVAPSSKKIRRESNNYGHSGRWVVLVSSSGEVRRMPFHLAFSLTSWTGAETWSPSEENQGPSFSSSSSSSSSSSLLSSSGRGGGGHFRSEERDNDVVVVTLKFSLDANQGVAELDRQPGDSDRFTSPAALDMVHRLRRECDAVLVGRSTVQSDNPSLTVRRVRPYTTQPPPTSPILDGKEVEEEEEEVDAFDASGRHRPRGGKEIQPLRVVLDPTLSLPFEHMAPQHNETTTNMTTTTYRLFTDGHPTVVYHTTQRANGVVGCVNDDKDTPLSWLFRNNSAVEFVQLPSSTSSSADACDNESTTDENVENVSLTMTATTTTTPSTTAPNEISVADILSDLSQRYQVKHVMVEGGPRTAHSFLKAGLVDRAIVVKALGVRFRRPLPSGITSQVLQEAGLICLGTYKIENDEDDVVEYWSRPNLPWPSGVGMDLRHWP